MEFEEALALGLTDEPNKRKREALDMFDKDEEEARKTYPGLIPMFESIVEEEKRKGFR